MKLLSVEEKTNWQTKMPMNIFDTEPKPTDLAIKASEIAGPFPSKGSTRH